MTANNHCPYRQATFLQQAISSDKMRIAFLLGAGCPVSIKICDDGNTIPLIPDVSNLTKLINDNILNNVSFKNHYEAVLKRLKDTGIVNPNIEQILTNIRTLQEVVGVSAIDGMTKPLLEGLDKEICVQITNTVNVTLPSVNTPYHKLATWIKGIQRTYPVEVFTPNYDLLIEQAFEYCRVPYFDGFVGSDRAFFDLASIEQDKLPARWARLWKVHGSYNWWRTMDGNVERRAGERTGDRQMIYPSHLKYDQSRRMPYLAMLDRLKTFIAQGQSVLITCGFSFTDQHINDVIAHGLNGNPNAICFGLLYEDKSKSREALLIARQQPNFNLLAIDGAIIGTNELDWRDDEQKDHPLNNTAIKIGDMEPRSTSPDKRCKLLLGDFNSLGEYLASQLSKNEEKKIDKHDK